MPAKRILAVKLADLGDVLLTEPAFRSLRTACPDAEIDVLTTPAARSMLDLLGLDLTPVIFDKHVFDSMRAALSPRSSPRLARLAASLRSRQYDAVAILHHLTTPAGALKFRALALATGCQTIAGLDNGRGTFLSHPVTDLGFGARHTAEYMLEVARAIGGADVDPAPRIDLQNLSEHVDSIDPGSGYAVLFPVTGPFAPGRNWPITYFARLARMLVDQGTDVVVAGAADATEAAGIIVRDVPEAHSLAGATTLRQLASLVSGAGVVVSGDSFPGHLAAAVGTPLVSIFGPSNHSAWGPYGAVPAGAPGGGNTCIIRNDVPCSPCLYSGYRLGRREGCSSPICLTGISPESVKQAIDAVIGKRA